MNMVKTLLTVAFCTIPALASEVYQIDPVHSEVSFRIRHLGLSKVYGRFVQYKGTIVLDEKNVGNSKVDVTIDAASINTENDKRDDHLRGPDFFHVEKFPTVIFKSVSVKRPGKDTFEVVGDLTMRGVTKRVTLPMTTTGTISSPSEFRRGFEGTFTLNRSDYGIDHMPAVIGQDVAITLEIAAVRTEVKP